MTNMTPALPTAPSGDLQTPFGTVTILECSSEQDRKHLDLTKKDIEEAVEWAEEDDDEIIPSTVAVENALRVSEGIMPFWPQHFDVYPLDGDIAIDSETVNRSFVMVVCKSDGSATTMITIRAKRSRRDWQMEELSALIEYAGRYLLVLRKMRGAVTLEYTINGRRGRTHWKGSVHIDLQTANSQVSAQQIAYAGVQGSTWQAHLGGQIECSVESFHDSPNSYGARLGSPADLLGLGRNQSINSDGWWTKGRRKTNLQKSLPRSHQTAPVH